jgi:hypothetical protein
MVGVRVQHRCEEPVGTVMWFDATVTGIATRKNDPLSTEYTIVYDETSDDTWTFPLLRDLKRGDLIIKV